jgi:UDP-N-acetyl-D-mannosaminuronic acid dehydrogenase
MNIKKTNITVSIVGMGFVGLTLAVALAKKNITVYGVEINDHILEKLSNKKAHFFEPNLDYELSKLIGNSLHFGNKLPESIIFDAHIITVGTPLKEDNSADFTHLLNSLEAIKKNYSGKELIILRSTVAVGVTRDLVCKELAMLSGLKNEDLRVAFCPERTIEGNALVELTTLPQIVSGLNQESVDMAANLFEEITSKIVKVDSLESGELVKLFNNTYRDAHFAIGNMLNVISQKYGIDGVKIINAANFEYPRSRIPLPGFVGGPCLEKDTYILEANTDKNNDGGAMSLLVAARKHNEWLSQRVVEWLLAQKKLIGDKPIVLTGLAFKGQPETTDLRGSVALEILSKLSSTFEIRLHDFSVDIVDIKMLNSGQVFEDLSKACQGAKALIILNNNTKYKNIDFYELQGVMDDNPIILDSWNILKMVKSENNILHIGNFMIEVQDE